ncbi:MAG: class I SAM-dependent methyltransferase [Arachnia sp.]
MAHHDHAMMDENMTAGQVKRYDRTAGIFGFAYARLAKNALDGVPGDALVADIGAGPGQLGSAVASFRNDVRVVGVDPSPEMVKRCNARLRRFGDRASARVGAAERLPFADDEVDLVVATFSLHHWVDAAAAAQEIRRVLAPGGVARIYDFHSSDFAALQRSFAPNATPLAPTRFALTPLGFPALSVIELTHP